jgi:hypothetical protein
MELAKQAQKAYLSKTLEYVESYLKSKASQELKV